MSVGGRDGAYVLNVTLARAVAWKKLRQSPHAVSLGTDGKQDLAEIDIRYHLRQLKAELRIG